MQRALLLLPWLLCAGPVMAAGTVYQCRAGNGQLIFQDTPCGKARDQRRLTLPDPPPTPAPDPVRAEQTVPPPAPAIPAPVPPEPMRASIPRMYGCVGAVDGKPYVSPRRPAPYLAPYGMLGSDQLPLSEAYGPTRGAAGISAPEANRGRVTTGLAAGNYVWVQDRCRELTSQEVCSALRDDFDRNAHALSKAFKTDRPPLEKRDRELRAQLEGC